MTMKDLPKWVIEMSEEEWLALPGEAYVNCFECGKRLIITLCRYDESTHYCFEHCPGHKWQTDYDWRMECARCGIGYAEYLESVLQEHCIDYHSAASTIQQYSEGKETKTHE